MEIKKDADGNVIEPTAEELKIQLEKVEEEKENYKKGLLEREAKIKELKEKGERKDEDEEDKDDDEDTDWDDASKRFQEETISKTEKKAEEIVNKAIEAKNEKQAIMDFRESHSDITDEQWEKILLNYTPKNGKDTQKAIIKDLERADVLRRFDAGEKIDPAEIRKNEAQDKLKDLSSNAQLGNSGKYNEQGNNISDGQLNIASRMRVSQESLEKEDDSLEAEIKIS